MILALGGVAEASLVRLLAADVVRPEIGVALAILVAVLTAVGGGLWPGVATAVLGLALVPVFVTDRPLETGLALAAGLGVAVLAGHAAHRLRRSEKDRHLVGDELRVLRETLDAVIGIDLDGTIASWSAGAARIYGYEPGEAIGQPFSMLVASQRRGSVIDVVEQPRREGSGDRREQIHRRADGGEVTVALSIAPVLDERGEMVAVYAVATDVSELAELKGQLSEVGWKYRALVEGLPLVTYLHDPDDAAAVFYVSPQIESILGYSAEDWLAEPELFKRLLHPEDRDRVLARAGDVSEYRMFARDGRMVWLHDGSTIVRDAEGRPLYGQGYLLDISDRKALDTERDALVTAERAALTRASQKQDRIDLLAEASDVLASSLDYEKTLGKVAGLVVRQLADWCMVDVLDAKGQLEPLGVAHAEPTSAENMLERDGHEPLAYKVIETRRPEMGRALHLASSDGSDEQTSRSESYICVPLLIRQRAVGSLTLISTMRGRRYGPDDLALAEDLARRVAGAIDNARLYEEVEDRAEAARVLAYVGDGVFLVDRTGVIRLWNPAAEAITGIEASSVVGKEACDVIPAWETVVDRVPVSQTREASQAKTVPLETPKGERWISISGVDFFGGTVYAFRDFTEERRLDELKAEFVATASHELRTPLAAVYGAAQTLRRHDFALDEAGRERFVSLIAEEAERLSRIVNEILLASQLEAGRLDVAGEPFDPLELVERVVESAREHVPPALTLEIVEPPSNPPVSADRDKVRQVLINLIENAIKYSPDGGTVRVGLEPAETVLRFWVKDEGLGIPPEEQERIFDKFYRLDPEMTRGVGGTGLGLYICSELVARMGGRISVESAEGEGSVFSFELPLAEPSALRPANDDRSGSLASVDRS